MGLAFSRPKRTATQEGAKGSHPSSLHEQPRIWGKEVGHEGPNRADSIAGGDNLKQRSHRTAHRLLTLIDTLNDFSTHTHTTGANAILPTMVKTSSTLRWFEALSDPPILRSSLVRFARGFWRAMKMMNDEGRRLYHDEDAPRRLKIVKFESGVPQLPWVVALRFPLFLFCNFC